MSSCSNKRKTNSRYPVPKLHLAQKVTLTDLCPEEKGKIGELILLIQKHRQDNNNLSVQNQSLKQTNQELTEKVIRLEFEKGKQEERVKQLCKLMDDFQEHLNKKEQEFKNYEKKVQKIVQHRQTQVDLDKEKGQTSFRTGSNISVHIDTQTEDIHLSNHKRSQQMEDEGYKSQQRQRHKSKKHSKAYKRIMNGLNSISKAVEQKLSKKKSKSINESASQIEQDEEFSNLARLWFRIKKQNTKQSFISHPFRSVDSAQGSGDYDKLITHYNRLKLSDVTQKQDRIDQFDLNEMLKRKDFKANDVLASAGRSEKEKRTLDYY